MFREQARKRLTKKAKKGFRGFPVATVAFYGPDNRRASKLAVGIILAENEEAVELKRWFAEPGDVREDGRVAEEVLAYMDGFGVRSVAMVDRIIGCPHEEGIDYHGPTCPLCLTVTHIFLLWAKDLISLADLAASDSRARERTCSMKPVIGPRPSSGRPTLGVQDAPTVS